MSGAGDLLCGLQSGGVGGVADVPNVRFMPLRQHAEARFDGPQRVESTRSGPAPNGQKPPVVIGPQFPESGHTK